MLIQHRFLEESGGRSVLRAHVADSVAEWRVEKDVNLLFQVGLQQGVRHFMYENRTRRRP